MTTLSKLLRTSYRALLVVTIGCIFLNVYGGTCNGTGGTGFCVDNGTGGTGFSESCNGLGGTGICVDNGTGGAGLRGIVTKKGEKETASHKVVSISRLEGFTSSKKVAVLVGIENYNTQVSGFSSLNYAVDDVNLLQHTFKDQGYAVYPVTDTQATKKKVIDTINKAAKTLKNGDGTLVFAFSGHGLAEGRHNYLATYDARLSSLQNTAISVHEVIDAIRKTGVKRAVLFVDACRNDPFRGARAAGNTLIRTWLGGEGIQVLYGTGNRKLSLEDRELQRGVFTHFVNKGLNGEAKRADGTVDFDNLANYVMREVPQYTKRYMGRIQQPWRGGTEYFGDFVLSANEKQVDSLTLAMGVEPKSPITPAWQNDGKVKQDPEAKRRLQQAEQKKWKARQAAIAKLRENEIQRRNIRIRNSRKALNTDHNLKKNALRIECRRRSNNLKSQFQKRMLNYDIALRQQLNTLPSTIDVKQRLQAESRYKSNTIRQKRILNDDNKHRQLIITRECADKARLLNRKFKLRINDFERTLQKK